LEIECQGLKKALASLERSYHITLEVLGEALGLKTHEIEGPSKRVTVFTICIARAMGAFAVMNWCTKFHFLPTLPRLFTPTTNGTTALVIPVDFPCQTTYGRT
jgi:hypothetical protein